MILKGNRNKSWDLTLWMVSSVSDCAAKFSKCFPAKTFDVSWRSIVASTSNIFSIRAEICAAGPFDAEEGDDLTGGECCTDETTLVSSLDIKPIFRSISSQSELRTVSANSWLPRALCPLSEAAMALSSLSFGRRISASRRSRSPMILSWLLALAHVICLRVWPNHVFSSFTSVLKKKTSHWKYFETHSRRRNIKNSKKPFMEQPLRNKKIIFQQEKHNFKGSQKRSVSSKNNKIQ